MTHPGDFATAEDALDWLFGRINYERSAIPANTQRVFKLDRMRRLLAELGDPQDRLRIVHLAGTKGKGSTAAMIASALRCAGLRIGLYTSPHLNRLEERFQVDGELCTPAELLDLTNIAARVVHSLDALEEARRTTFFEITTAMGLLHFARREVQAAVLETGLGGRLDSTNVCQPELTVITSISYDHTKVLGSTLAAIAGEKAGIIKRDVPIVSGVLNDEPRLVIADKARVTGAPLIQRGEHFDCQRHALVAASRLMEERMDYWEQTGPQKTVMENVRVGMIGEHQTANAAVALASLSELRRNGWPLEEEALRKGIFEAKCSARVEIVSARPTVIIDAAHNVASIAALAQVLKERFPAQRRSLVFAAARDKDARGMLAILLPLFDDVRLTRFVSNPRAVEPQALQAMAEDVLRGEKAAATKTPRIEVIDEPDKALRQAISATPAEGLLCVTGSFFLAAELRPLAWDWLAPASPSAAAPACDEAPRKVG